MKRIISILILKTFLFCATADATNFYFSSTDGDDSRSSSEAQNQSTPWKTLNKLNSILGSLQAGDAVLFKRGDTFYGGIDLKGAGSDGSPISFGAYGSGDKPVITGFNAASSWTNVGGSVWETTDAISSLSSCNMVVVNKTFAPIGRWPNTGYRNISSHSGSSSITDASLSSSPNWTGAEVVIRKEHWIIDRNVITSHSGNTIAYTSGSTYSARDGYGYFIQNSPSALDQQNEWYYNSSTKKLGIFSSGSPSNVQASTIDNLFSISGSSFITLDNLQLQGANNDAVRVSKSNHITVQNCDISFSGRDGIGGDAWDGNSGYLTVQNCTINWSNNGGIHCWDDFTNAALTNNLVQNSGTIPGMGASGDDAYEGIQLKANNAVIANNQVINSGYIGIMFRGNSSIVKNNFVNYFNITKDDGGGIYTNNNYSGRQILNNIVLNGIGNTQGTSNSSSIQTEGIYMDDHTTDVIISGNTVANIGFSGIFLHNAHEITVENNTVFNCASQITFSHDNISPNDPIRNIIMTGNKFIAKTASQVSLYFSTVSNDVSSFGKADNNYYARPINDNSTISIFPNASSLLSNALSGWQSLSHQDANSKKSPKSIKDVSDLRFEYNASSSDKVVNLGATYMDITGATYAGSIKLAAFSSAVLIYVSGTVSTNQPPVANAGSPVKIVLPISLAVLDGTASKDTDGTIVSYNWSKISGPSSPLILTPTLAVTTVTTLGQGIYQFELKVTDNEGAVGRDTVTITVNDASGVNQPPVADAGSDIKVDLPVDSVTLTGTGSDKDGNISSYQWTKLSGPGCTISDSSQATTIVDNLEAGSYVFELQVTDNDKSIARDTIQVTVDSSSAASGRAIKVNLYGGINAYSDSEWNNWNVIASKTSTPFHYSNGDTSNVIANISYGRRVLENLPGNPGVMAPPPVLRYASYTSNDRTLTINGLPATQPYKIELFSSQDSLESNTTILRVNQQSDSISTFKNFSKVAALSGLLPNDQGQLVIDILSPNGVNFLNGFVLTQTDSAGSSTGEPQRSKPSRLSENSQSPAMNTFSIYPNPVSDNFTLDLNNMYTGKMSIEIISQSGSVVRSVNTEKNEQVSRTILPSNGLTAGVYFARVRIGTWTDTKRFVKL